MFEEMKEKFDEARKIAADQWSDPQSVTNYALDGACIALGALGVAKATTTAAAAVGGAAIALGTIGLACRSVDAYAALRSTKREPRDITGESQRVS